MSARTQARGCAATSLAAKVKITITKVPRMRYLMARSPSVPAPLPLSNAGQEQKTNRKNGSA
jgi:hypothetical protein